MPKQDPARSKIFFYISAMIDESFIHDIGNLQFSQVVCPNYQ